MGFRRLLVFLAACPAPSAGPPLPVVEDATAAARALLRPGCGLSPELVGAMACPAGGGFRPLANTYPASTVMVGYLDNPAYLRDLAGILAGREPATKLIIAVPANELPRARPRLAALTRPPFDRQVEIVEVPTGQNTFWMQDIMEAGVSGASSEPAILDLPRPSSDQLTAELARRCGLRLEPEPKLACDYVNQQPAARVPPACRDARIGYNFGGNLEGYPGGLAVVGKGMEKSILDRLAEGNPHAPHEVDLSWLLVGHVDELFNVVPTDAPAPCDFSILYASPARGLAVARTLAAAAGRRPENLEPPINFCDRPDGSGSDCDNETDSGAQPRVPGDCMANLPTAIYRAPLGARAALACPEFVRANRRYEELVQAELAKLKTAVARSSGCAHPLAVGLPQLFRTEAKAKAGTAYGTVADGATGVNANIINGLVVNRTLILAKQFNPELERDVLSQLAIAGVKRERVEFLDDRVMNAGGGGIHCTSNVFRVCAPASR